MNEGRSVHSVAADFGISARADYRWLVRFREHGYAGLHSTSSRPHSSPYQLPDSWIVCIRLYRQTFKWCARKIAENEMDPPT
ncbi:leucine zipper domain-containing protein [Marinobacterium jannaschii]|uniref:leucine zipper domain-containing protein n=1 Tax=Marinobacterium jannaschii TaxID=64970 RepID=UPI000A04DD93